MSNKKEVVPPAASVEADDLLRFLATMVTAAQDEVVSNSALEEMDAINQMRVVAESLASEPLILYSASSS
jgi:hypothetical protein